MVAECGPSGVGVNAFSLGPIHTEGTAVVDEVVDHVAAIAPR
jgi:hypothetical protein